MLAHLTLNTGHLRTSPRAEVGEHAIRALDALAKNGGVIPGIKPALTLSVIRWEGAAIVMIGSGKAAAIALALQWQESPAVPPDGQDAKAWRVFMASGEKDLRGHAMPWLAVFLFPAANMLSRETLMALGDLERCIAWTILAQEGLAP